MSTHETADTGEAERFRADLAGVDPTSFKKTTLKRHNPRTVRKNAAEAYRGYLITHATKSADLYRRMEGAWYGIVLGATR
ncbi:hypothetical protein [Streptomyces sp. NPDC127084]|uniref:hypothetical protein n=1 Tax=Streptomyces sp. NPDC127084 TaxID=3347133 RepID=UPI0036546F79